MSTRNLKANEFIDAAGDSWHVRFTMLDLLDGFQEVDIRLEDLEEIEKANVGSFMKLLWYGCRKLAKARGIKRDAFWTERVTPAQLKPAMDALAAALQDAFPGEEDVGAQEGATPDPLAGEAGTVGT